jgi:hypothetical protein
VCEIKIWDVSFGLNYGSLTVFKILKATTFQRHKNGFSDLPDFAVNRWTVQKTATNGENEYIIS